MEKEQGPKMVEGFLVPEVGTMNRIIRGAIATTAGFTTSVLAAYAGSQAASYSPEIGNGIGVILSKMGHGVGETITDVQLLIKTITEHPEYFTGISNESVSRDVIDAGSRLYEYLQDDANAAIGNLVRNPIETVISSFGLASLIKGLGNIWIKLISHQDIPDFNQRIRSGITNALRRKDKSRRISIPKMGGNTFSRK